MKQTKEQSIGQIETKGKSCLGGNNQKVGTDRSNRLLFVQPILSI